MPSIKFPWQGGPVEGEDVIGLSVGGPRVCVSIHLDVVRVSEDGVRTAPMRSSRQVVRDFENQEDAADWLRSYAPPVIELSQPLVSYYTTTRYMVGDETVPHINSDIGMYLDISPTSPIYFTK